MSLLVKSNQVATNYLGDRFGVMGRLGWSLMMDFSNQEYLLNKTAMPLSTLLQNTRNYSALVFNEVGEPTVIASNQPRMSYNKDQKEFGLLSESLGVGYITPSQNPVSGTYPLPVYKSTDVYKLECTGTGSVDVTGANIVKKVGLGTQDSPIIFTMSAAGDVNLTVTGDVTYANIIIQEVVATQNTKHILELVDNAVRAEVNTVDLTDIVLADDWTVLFACKNNEIYNESKTLAGDTTITTPFMQIGSDTNHVALGRTRFSAMKSDELRIMLREGGVSKYEIITALDPSYVVIGVTCSAEGLFVSVNGRTTEAITSIESFTPSKLIVGQAPTFTKTINANALFSKIVVYKNAVSKDELTKLTRDSF